MSKNKELPTYKRLTFLPLKRRKETHKSCLKIKIGRLELYVNFSPDYLSERVKNPVAQNLSPYVRVRFSRRNSTFGKNVFERF